MLFVGLTLFWRMRQYWMTFCLIDHLFDQEIQRDSIHLCRMAFLHKKNRNSALRQDGFSHGNPSVRRVNHWIVSIQICNPLIKSARSLRYNTENGSTVSTSFWILTINVAKISPKDLLNTSCNRFKCLCSAEWEVRSKSNRIRHDFYITVSMVGPTETGYILVKLNTADKNTLNHARCSIYHNILHRFVFGMQNQLISIVVNSL